MNLNALQVNLACRKLTLAEMEIYVKSKCINIVLVQETTLFKAKKHPKIFGYEFIGNKFVSCYIKNGIIYNVKHICNEYIILELTSFTIVNVYLSGP